MATPAVKKITLEDLIGPPVEKEEAEVVTTPTPIADIKTAPPEVDVSAQAATLPETS